MASAAKHRALGWIAVFKMVKAAALLVVAAGALRLVRPDALDGFVEYLDHLPLAAGFKPIDRFIHWVGDLSPHNLELIAVLACAYAALYSVEGIGLWLHKRWAEYLTTIATASLIPFELWELAHGMSATKFAALAINVAIVLYLIYVLRADKKISA
jgi:uncharacterized membrane protein (DUF2068 family)